MSRAEDLHLKARRAANIGAYARATRYLDQATESRRDPGLSARIEVTRAYVEAETGSPQCGDPALPRGPCARGPRRRDTGADLVAAGPDPDAHGRERAGHGGLRHRHLGPSGGRRVPRPHAAEPGQRPPAARRPEGRRGGLLRSPGTSLARAGLALQQAKAEHNLGYARLLTGDLVGALQMIDRAALVLAPQSAVNRATDRAGPGRGPDGGGPAARGGAGAAGGGRGVRLASAAHLPGRVRALPGPDAAAPGPGPREGRGPACGTTLPGARQPGSRPARGRAGSRRGDLGRRAEPGHPRPAPTSSPDS